MNEWSRSQVKSSHHPLLSLLPRKHSVFQTNSQRIFTLPYNLSQTKMVAPFYSILCMNICVSLNFGWRNTSIHISQDMFFGCYANQPDTLQRFILTTVIEAVKSEGKCLKSEYHHQPPQDDNNNDNYRFPLPTQVEDFKAKRHRKCSNFLHSIFRLSSLLCCSLLSWERVVSRNMQMFILICLSGNDKMMMGFCFVSFPRKND